MMEEEKLRMKEEQGSDFEEEEDEAEEEEEEEEDPVELAELKKGISVSSVKVEEESEDNQLEVTSPGENTSVRKVSLSPVCSLTSNLSLQASLSLPGSPAQRRLSRSSQSGSHSYSLRRQWVRSSFLDTRDQLPFADDSRVCSPAGSLDGQVIQLNQWWPGLSRHSRQNSYSSHTSRVTYNSHAELTRGRGQHLYH